MKKFALLAIFAFSIVLPALCQGMPSDVPPDHYAYDAISDLVDRGINVSQGYPDGTFRGDTKTSRYENAYFMASLALNLRKTASIEIDFSDIKEEIAWLRNELAGMKQQPESKNDMKYYGSAELNSMFGSVFAYNQDHRSSLGPETNYRFKYSIEKALGDDANLKLNLDTMDGAFNTSTSRTFATKLIDIEGNLVTDIGLEKPLKIKAIFGPGSVKHRDISGVAPSEDGIYYSRPRPTFMVGTSMGEWDVAGAYACREVKADGSVGTSEVNVQLGRKLGVVPLLGSIDVSSTTRYVFEDFMNPTYMANDFKQEISFLMTQSKEISEKLLVGSGSTDHPDSQYYLNFETYAKNLFNKGINLTLIFHSVGMNYRQPFDALEFISTNLFSRKVLDGTLDIGLEVAIPLSNSLTFKSRSDVVTDNFGKIDKDVPGSSYTQELSFDQMVNKDLSFNAFYRYYFVPSKTDQFSVTVPEASDLIGLSLIFRF